MVVLPAPFGPSRAKTVPSVTVRSMPLGGTVGGRHLVADLAVVGVHVEPGGGARPDADLDAAGGAAQRRRAADQLPDADVAVGRGRRYRGGGVVGRDVAVGGPDLQITAGVADPGLAVAVLEHGRPRDRAHLQLARAGGQVGVAGDGLGGHQPHPGRHGQGPGLLDLQIAGAAAQPAAAQSPGAADGADAQLGLELGRPLARHLPAVSSSDPGTGTP
jgi:hypothetical protein